jgi:glycine/serine hydroxymethyltransferase
LKKLALTDVVFIRNNMKGKKSEQATLKIIWTTRYTRSTTPQDSEVFEAIAAEYARQNEGLINCIRELCQPGCARGHGNFLTNKYAEGYPGKRYYGGCQKVDVVESLAIDGGKRIVWRWSCQCTTTFGAQANMAAYLSMIKPGDTVLGLKLDHGGHLPTVPPSTWAENCIILCNMG